MTRDQLLNEIDYAAGELQRAIVLLISLGNHTEGSTLRIIKRAVDTAEARVTSLKATMMVCNYTPESYRDKEASDGS